MLALADGGQYLYVSFVGESANARVDLDADVVDLRFGLGGDLGRTMPSTSSRSRVVLASSLSCGVPSAQDDIETIAVAATPDGHASPSFRTCGLRRYRGGGQNRDRATGFWQTSDGSTTTAPLLYRFTVSATVKIGGDLSGTFTVAVGSGDYRWLPIGQGTVTGGADPWRRADIFRSARGGRQRMLRAIRRRASLSQPFSAKTFWAPRRPAPKSTGWPRSASTCSSADRATITSNSAA